MTKEACKKTYIRMMDSLRYGHKGELNCEGVGCSRCPLKSVCRYDHKVLLSNAFECIELVEKWGKEHPIVTNKELEKFEKAVIQQECIHVIENTDCELSPQVWKEISNNKMSLLPATPKQDPILDKSIAEIDKQEKWLAEAGYNAYNVGIAFNSIRLVLSESKDEGCKNERLDK